MNHTNTNFWLPVLLVLLLVPVAVPAETETATPAQLVDALNGIFGQHPGKRGSHAKGICAVGEFRSTADAASLSKAAHFNGEPVPATIRYSMGGGNPAISDKTNTGRGMAIRFELPDYEIMDMVMISVPLFFARTPEQALEFLLARQPDPATGKPDPARVEAFSKANPETLRQGAWLKENPLPDSYLSTPFFGVNAFKFTNADGESVYGRWHVLPAGGVVGVPEDEIESLSDDFLMDDLEQRLANGAADYEFYVQVAADDDVINDPTVLWPEQREKIHVGTLTVTEATGQDCDELMFSPVALVDGIEPSDDPVLAIRTPVYAESFIRRQ